MTDSCYKCPSKSFVKDKAGPHGYCKKYKVKVRWNGVCPPKDKWLPCEKE